MNFNLTALLQAQEKGYERSPTVVVYTIGWLIFNSYSNSCVLFLNVNNINIVSWLLYCDDAQWLDCVRFLMVLVT